MTVLRGAGVWKCSEGGEAYRREDPEEKERRSSRRCWILLGWGCGPRQHPWSSLPIASRYHLDEDISSKGMVSSKRERERDSKDCSLIGQQPLMLRDNPALERPSRHPAGPLVRYEKFVRMQ